MDQQTIIRPANLTEAALIAELSRQTFFDTFASQNTYENMQAFMETRFSCEKLMQELEDPTNLFFLAYQNNLVAGYLKLQDQHQPAILRNSRAMEIVRIYAVSSMIGKGVGKALMQKSIETALLRNNTILWLGVWQQNHRAIEFYQRWGFEIFGEQEFVLGNDIQTDWMMRKNL